MSATAIVCDNLFITVNSNIPIMNMTHLCSMRIAFTMMMDGNTVFSSIGLLEESIDKTFFEIHTLLEISFGQCEFNSHFYFVVAVIHYLINKHRHIHSR